MVDTSQVSTRHSILYSTIWADRITLSQTTHNLQQIMFIYFISHKTLLLFIFTFHWGLFEKKHSIMQQAWKSNTFEYNRKKQKVNLKNNMPFYIFLVNLLFIIQIKVETFWSETDATGWGNIHKRIFLNGRLLQHPRRPQLMIGSATITQTVTFIFYSILIYVTSFQSS